MALLATGYDMNSTNKEDLELVPEDIRNVVEPFNNFESLFNNKIVRSLFIIFIPFF